MSTNHKIEIVARLPGGRTRSERYESHSDYLRDLRQWRRYAQQKGLALEEVTRTTLTLHDENGPLFDGSDEEDPETNDPANQPETSDASAKS